MKKQGKSAFGDVVGLIYNAALRPKGWPDVLSAIADWVGSNSASLTIFNTDGRPSERFTFGYDAVFLQTYMQHHQDLEPWKKHLQRLTGRVCKIDNSKFSIVTPDQWKTYLSSEFYNDWTKSQGIYWMLGGFVCSTEWGSMKIGLQRTRNDPNFNTHDQQELLKIYPHLGHSIQIGRLFAQERGIRQSYEALLERFPQGIVLLDGAGRAVFHNRAAGVILSRADGFSMGRNGLAASHPTCNRELQWLIRGAIATGMGWEAMEGNAGTGGALPIPRETNIIPYQVLVLPLRTLSAPMGLEASGICAAVLIQDPLEPTGLDPALLVTLFGLTPAEAEVAGALAEGESPEEFAENANKSIHTVRTQVKSIHGKLGVSRQSQLVKLLLGSPASLGGGPSGKK